MGRVRIPQAKRRANSKAATGTRLTVKYLQQALAIMAYGSQDLYLSLYFELFKFESCDFS